MNGLKGAPLVPTKPSIVAHDSCTVTPILVTKLYSPVRGIPKTIHYQPYVCVRGVLYRISDDLPSGELRIRSILTLH